MEQDFLAVDYMKLMDEKLNEERNNFDPAELDSVSQTASYWHIQNYRISDYKQYDQFLKVESDYVTSFSYMVPFQFLDSREGRHPFSTDGSPVLRPQSQQPLKRSHKRRRHDARVVRATRRKNRSRKGDEPSFTGGASADTSDDEMADTSDSDDETPSPAAAFDAESKKDGKRFSADDASSSGGLSSSSVITRSETITSSNGSKLGASQKENPLQDQKQEGSVPQVTLTQSQEEQPTQSFRQKATLTLSRALTGNFDSTTKGQPEKGGEQQEGQNNTPSQSLLQKSGPPDQTSATGIVVLTRSNPTKRTHYEESSYDSMDSNAEEDCTDTSDGDTLAHHNSHIHNSHDPGEGIASGDTTDSDEESLEFGQIDEFIDDAYQVWVNNMDSKVRQKCTKLSTVVSTYMQQT